MNALTVGSTMTKSLVIDSCIIIAFIHPDIKLLDFVTQNIGDIYINSITLKEELEDHKDMLRHMSYTLIEDNIEDMCLARQMNGPTSFHDNLQMLSCLKYGYTCVTNDRDLINLCKKNSVNVMWGLELIIELVKTKIITKDRATTMFSKSGIDKRYLCRLFPDAG